jgi:hypothetical protein
MIEIGMTVSMMSGVFHSWRKMRRTRKARIAPWMISSRTAPMAVWM